MTRLTLRVLQMRQHRGWSQAELARRSGVNQGSISRIEAGHTKGVELATLEKLARALGVSPRSLLAATKR